MSDTLLPARFLFRFSLPCLRRNPLWPTTRAGLEDKYRLANLAELEGRAAWADVRAAWSEAGLVMAVQVEAKRQPVWCRATRPEDSDGFHVWIDTRDVHSVHRAGRFCHRFIFLPTGGGRQLDEPLAALLPINRAREQPRPVHPERIQIRSQTCAGGYMLAAFLPAEVLTGFDPQEHPQLGFAYGVLDRELGEQTLTVGSPMLYQEDPSLWATLELAR
jgi:hypothetical protein